MTSIHKLTRQIKKLSTFLVLVVSYHCRLLLYMYVSRRDRSFTVCVIHYLFWAAQCEFKSSYIQLSPSKGLSTTQGFWFFSQHSILCVCVRAHTHSGHRSASLCQTEKHVCVLAQTQSEKKLFCAAWEEMQGYFQFTLTKSIAFFKH